MAAPAVSSISSTHTAPDWRTAESTAPTDRRPPVRLSRGQGPGSFARAWTYSLKLQPRLQRLALAMAWFAGPDGMVTASRASIGAEVRFTNRKGITARQVQRGLPDLIRMGFAIENGWHVHGYRPDGRPIRTRRYWLPVGTPRELLAEATPLTEVRAGFRKAIQELAASECHSLEPPTEAGGENVESDISERPKGHLEAKMSHNPLNTDLESENQNLTGAAREAAEPRPPAEPPPKQATAPPGQPPIPPASYPHPTYRETPAERRERRKRETAIVEADPNRVFSKSELRRGGLGGTSERPLQTESIAQKLARKGHGP